MPVAAASDNVRDWWHPYGDYDGLEVLKGAVMACHLDTAPSEGAWAHVVSATPARAMGFKSGVAEGAPADLVLFPGARRFSELLARPQAGRVVLRGGRVQESELPAYRELDDVVAVASPPALAEDVGRGATTKDAMTA